MPPAPDTNRLKEEVASEAIQAHYARIEALCAIAFPLGMRVAVRMIEPEISIPDMFWRIFEGTMGTPKFELRFEHVMLSPGEKPPEGHRWTIYEDRSGIPMGRSA